MSHEPQNPDEAAGSEPLIRPTLSPEAARLREGLGLPIRLLPAARCGTRSALWQDSTDLNRLIAGESVSRASWSPRAAGCPGGSPADRRVRCDLCFDPFWHPPEIETLERLDGLSMRAEWRRRLRRSACWAAAGAAFAPEHDFFEDWSDGACGDFGADGRGKDYTDGMAHFQAARAFGVESLLEHLEVDRGGLFLDVLGGDGYVMRLLEASRRLRSDDGSSSPDAVPLMITNDISRHMFYRAGLWGLATREDAHSLSRTFRPGSLDGVLFAYGTHHVLGFESAVREAATILRPGGRLVVHDFLGEGKVGRWFRQVVHPESRTGHDFAHPSPIQMAVYLLLAGLRDVQIFEMDDPFVFAAAPDGDEDARRLACTYLAGMYGLTESFQGQHDRLQRLAEEILCYPEIGNVARFDRDLVYVPRRAMVVSGRRPLDGDAPFADADTRLIERIAELLDAPPEKVLARVPVEPEVASVWFAGGDLRWNLSLEECRRWADWRAAAPRPRRSELP